MHHLVVKNNRVEGKTTKIGYEGGKDGNDLPVCPKPRRPRSTVPREVLKPFKCINAYSHTTNIDGENEAINMIITDKKSSEEREPLCYYTGSPPQRTGNPLIHDVHFINQVELFSPLASLKN
ncbi:hypothetical protein L6452_43960 [Arctium lappa]|uniref:Uncharacterized protein n=1 Tax=Arctium lappa TaxID=4217 RepID=A0ACB8XFI2_ARCLA|nr:hypothetical protein L6452_43960 [Arctium lappa]